MDLRIAQDLDKVLANFNGGVLVNPGFIAARELQKRELQFRSWEYINELIRLELIKESTVKNQKGFYRMTFKGRAFEGFENILERENREKENNKFHKVILTWFTGLATCAAVAAFLFQVWTYEAPNKIENAENLNRTLTTQKEQLEELYNQSIYKQAQTYPYERELVKLRDSISKSSDRLLHGVSQER